MLTTVGWNVCPPGESVRVLDGGSIRARTAAAVVILRHQASGKLVPCSINTRPPPPICLTYWPTPAASCCYALLLHVVGSHQQAESHLQRAFEVPRGTIMEPLEGPPMGSWEEPMGTQGGPLGTHGAMDPGLWGPMGQGTHWPRTRASGDPGPWGPGASGDPGPMGTPGQKTFRRVAGLTVSFIK